jgi:hypothetical protein
MEMDYEEDMDEREKMKMKENKMEQEEGANKKSMRRVGNGSKWMNVWRRKISVRRSD